MVFTGIVEEVGSVRAVTAGRIALAATIVLEGTGLGDSILVNGVCLTAAEVTAEGFSADVVPETFRRTNLGALRPGHPVNLERALPVTGRLGGHIVQGHIEGTAELVGLVPDGADGVIYRFRPPPGLLPYIVSKGFIAIDGVSLTVVECAASEFSVTLIPFTRSHTNLGARRPGDTVNLETDIVARYVERFLQFLPPP